METRIGRRGDMVMIGFRELDLNQVTVVRALDIVVNQWGIPITIVTDRLADGVAGAGIKTGSVAKAKAVAAAMKKGHFDLEDLVELVRCAPRTHAQRAKH